jgi:MFS transporter, MHS family, shikimate and dehydroshikimate transport protein
MDARGGDPRRAALAAFLGTVMEYYDLVIYGTAAALVFGNLFFREVNPQIALVLSFATFASGYLVRPLGAVIFGHIGDRRGRRTAVLSTLWLMGASTVLIGLLPTYDTVGALAPVLLVALRVCQGLAVGGELGGAVLISVEHAPERKRGFYGSFSTAGAQAGTVLSTSVFAIVTLLPPEQFQSWGWRLPFLLSALIVFVGVLVRRGIAETPDFTKAATQRQPVRTAVLRHPRTILGITLVMAGMMSIWYVLTVYGLTYAVNTAGVDRTTMLWVVTVATALVVVMNPVWGALSDRTHRGRLLALGLVLEGGLLFGFIAALQSRSLPLILGSLLLVVGIGHAAANGIFPAFIAESLPAEVRYTAGSLGMQLAGVVAGFAPLLAVMFERAGFGLWLIASLCFALCLAGAASAVALLKPRDAAPRRELRPTITA